MNVYEVLAIYDGCNDKAMELSDDFFGTQSFDTNNNTLEILYFHDFYAAQRNRPPYSL